jgi:hypothetical protein
MDDIPRRAGRPLQRLSRAEHLLVGALRAIVLDHGERP